MATLQNLLDDLNQRLGDANNAAGVGEATKIRWLAHGIRAMWPKVYINVIDDSTLVIDDATYEYALPATFDDAEVFRIDVQVGPSLERWARVDSYLIDRRADKRLIFDRLPGIDGASLRIHAVAPCVSSGLTTASTVDFPDRYLELPVWYALGLAMQNGQDQTMEGRLDYRRYSAITGRNGVDIGEMMSAGQFCFAQFELLLDRLAMPWPVG